MAKKKFTSFIYNMNGIKSPVISYLSSVTKEIKHSEYPLTRLDYSKLEGIQSDIPVFEGLKIPDIAFITKYLETINFFRGCRCGCLHCLKNAFAPKNGRESILFEDLKNLADGLKTLSERLGFNVLNGSRYISIIDDSNPLDMPIKGLTKEHDTVEGIKLLYDKLKIPVLVVSSGIDTTSKKRENYTTKVAKKLNKTAVKYPDSIESVQISINPFLKTRDYADRIAKTLLIFLDLFKTEKAKIIYRHSDDNNSEYNAEAAKKLYQKIYTLLQSKVGYSLEGLPQLKPEVLTKFDKSHLIEPSGRGRKFFSLKRNMQLQQELIRDKIDWESLSEEDKKNKLFNYALKCIDIDGSVYATMPSNAKSENAPIELIAPTNIKLNYINKEKPNPIFSDIELS